MTFDAASLGRAHARRAAAVAAIAGLAFVTRPSTIADSERMALASRFHFTELAMPDPPTDPSTWKSVRSVCPSLARISSWISSVGAAVSVGDLDGDGLANDLVHVDPRADTAVVEPATGTGSRYAPIVLDPRPLPFDSATTAPMGSVIGDLDEDGREDVLVYYWGRTPVAFLRRGDRYEPCEVSTSGERWFTNAATLADVDGDGHADLVVGNYFPDGAHVLDAAWTGPAEMQASMSRSWNGGKNRILLGSRASDGCVKFDEAVGALDDAVAMGWTLAIGAADLDGDLLPEIYFANDFGMDRLLHNRSTPGHPSFATLEGRRGFATPSSSVLGRDSFKGMGVDFGDVNGDGLLDIYVSNIAGEFQLLESHFLWASTGDVSAMKRGVAPYVNASEALGLSRSGWAWDCKLADFDDDGTLEAMQTTGFVRGTTNRWPELQELAMANDWWLAEPRAWPRFQPGDDVSGDIRMPFFVRGSDARFVDLAREVGLGAVQVSRGIAIADVDGDGDLDLAVANQWEPSRFYRNDASPAGAFLGLRLVLPLEPEPTSVVDDLRLPSRAPARPAIGAEVAVTLPNGRRLVSQVDGGSGHSGRRSSDVHFGLGKVPASSRLKVEIAWRDPLGTPHRETLDLAPGWRVVRLGWPRSGGER
ncbi:MAG: CRTAC1 family protein [Planctomycetes bacterium]|nr:CRTAC1 family protein [Planctomycetota bacterium]